MTRTLYAIVRFELKKGEIDTLVPLIKEFFDKEVSVFPGFVSARIHSNEEGTVLINYAKWESLEKFQGFLTQLARVSPIARKIQMFQQKTDLVFEIPLTSANL